MIEHRMRPPIAIRLKARVSFFRIRTVDLECPTSPASDLIFTLLEKWTGKRVELFRTYNRTIAAGQANAVEMIARNWANITSDDATAMMEEQDANLLGQKALATNLLGAQFEKTF